jgi:hypothetical protein
MFGFARMIVGFILGLIEIALTLRFVFKFLNVGSRSSLVGMIYDFTSPIVAPFSGIISNIDLGPFTIDSQTAIALIVFTVLSALVMGVLNIKSGGA